MRDRRTFLKEACAVTLLGATAKGAIAMEREEQAQIRITGEWEIEVSAGIFLTGRKRVRITHNTALKVTPTTILTVKDEKYDALPVYNPKAAPWGRGAKLKQLATAETTSPGMLVAGSLVLKSAPGSGSTYQMGKDYDLEAHWATFGRIEGGIPENTPIWADYVCGWGRIDSVVVEKGGKVVLREGKAHNATPQAPTITAKETRIANIWLPGNLKRLNEASLYPIIEPVYPLAKRSGENTAQRSLPQTYRKLTSGEPLHILAWGDSVTAGGEASSVEKQYQSRFVALLKKRFPQSNIRLTTAGWGGRNTDSFLNEPPGAEFNFDHAVISKRPDLIVMEFVNDAWMSPEVVEQKYAYLLKRFQEIGAEWVILTPHYVRPDWMSSSTERVETDPRPYVTGVRQFCAKHGVAVADASLRWGHLVKEGTPYMTLLSNSINHPNDAGHELFAQALIELF